MVPVAKRRVRLPRGLVNGPLVPCTEIDFRLDTLLGLVLASRLARAALWQLGLREEKPRARASDDTRIQIVRTEDPLPCP